MSGFTMPAQNYVAPSGTIDGPIERSLCPDSGTTLRCSWNASGLVSFTGHFRNRSTNALIGPQSFVNNSSGNWLFTADPGYNSVTPFNFEFDSITSNGHSIAFTFSVDSGTPYSGVKVRRSGSWVFTPIFVRRSGSWVWSPVFVRRSGVWVLSHK